MITIIWELNKDYIGQIMLTVGSVPCSLRNGILKWWKMKKTSQSVVIFSMSDEEEFPRKLNSPSGFVFKPFKKISYWKLGIQLIQITFLCDFELNSKNAKFLPYSKMWGIGSSFQKIWTVFLALTSARDRSIGVSLYINQLFLYLTNKFYKVCDVYLVYY